MSVLRREAFEFAGGLLVGEDADSGWRPHLPYGMNGKGVSDRAFHALRSGRLSLHMLRDLGILVPSPRQIFAPANHP
jgi:hypothetical protein